MNYTKHYNILIARAKHRTINGYSEKHHIIPKCLGGTNKKENLVHLTAREHYVAHQLLVKINPQHHGLVKAAAMMVCESSNQQRSKNRQYSWLKEKHSAVMSAAQTGKGNSQFGTKWMYNFKTRDCKKMQYADLEVFESQGWAYGRVVDWNTRICPGCLIEKLPNRKTCKKCKPPAKQHNIAGCKKGGRNRATTSRSEVIQALNNSNSFKECLEILGYKSLGNSFNRVKRIALEEGITF